VKVTFDPRAAEQLEGQLDYLLQRHAISAAVRLEARCTSFLETFLVAHPSTGKFVAEIDVWETWIPGTRLVIWYRFTSDELQVIRIWHSSQQRSS